MRILLSFLLLMSFAASAEVYKWVDEEGNVQFGDKPESEKSEPVKVRDDTAKGVDATKELEKTREIIQYSPEERAKREREKSKEQQTVQEECVKAKDRLVKYKASPVLMETDKEGKSVPLSKEERDKAIAELEQKILDICKPN